MNLKTKITSAILIFVLFVQCNSDQSNALENQAKDTRALVQKAHQEIGAMNITYTLNKERAAIYKKQAEEAEGLEKLNLLIQFAVEMLNGGETEEAIQNLNYVIDVAKKSGLSLEDKVGIKLLSALGIAYMRQGEQENCIKHNNHQSCIIPIGEDGIHKLPEGSTKAIKVFEEILTIDPNHQQSIWLMNLAHMTLGTYPDGVAKEFLLSPEYFEQNKGSFKTFKNIASKVGIDDGRLSGGAIMDDFDNDGDIDIIMTSWGIHDELIYYVNDGKGSFQNLTKQKGLEGIVGGLNIKQTDYNNDGYLDVYIMRGAWMRNDGEIPNTLLKNNGDGSFTDMTIQAGLMTHTPTQSASWNDFNRDGWLDLLVVNESFGNYQYPTQLWINDQNGGFKDVGEQARLIQTGYFKGVSVDDFNNDGWPDIYVSSLGTDNVLYINQGLDKNGVPFFGQGAKQAGVDGPKFSFPNFIFDFNNDGLNDILVSSFQSDINDPASDLSLNIQNQYTGGKTHLYINTGKGKFVDISDEINLTEAIYTMGCNYGDLDNDGWLDFYLATGDPNFSSIVPNKMYRNFEGKAVQDVTFTGGFGHIQKGHGVSMSDIDRDGQLDIYTVLGGAYEGDNFQNALFYNPGNENKWVMLELEGIKSNKKAIGARVHVSIQENGKSRSIFRTLNSGASFGANGLEMLIGLGNASHIESIDVLWPIKDSRWERYTSFEPYKFYKIIEGQSTPVLKEIKSVPLKMDHEHHHHH